MFTFIWIYYELMDIEMHYIYTHVVYWDVNFVGHTLFFIKGSVSH